MFFNNPYDDEAFMDDKQQDVTNAVVSELSKIADHQTAQEDAEVGDVAFDRFAAGNALITQWEKEAKERLEDVLRVRTAKPRYALVDGEKVVVSILKNGAKVYAAGDADGKPLVHDGRRGVIDPFNGRLRFQVKHEQVMNPAAVEFDNSNGLERSQAALALLAPAFMSFVKAIKPVKDLYRNYTRMERFKMKVAFRLAVIMVAVRKFFKRKPKKHESFMVVDKLDITIPPRLSKQINSLQYEIDGTNKLAFARFAVMRAPLDPQGNIPEEYLKRWQSFLYDMAARNIWKYGVLATPSSIALPTGPDLHYEKTIFTAFFTDQSPADNYGEKEAAEALNKLVGFDVFFAGGEIPSSSDWSKFPW